MACRENNSFLDTSGSNKHGSTNEVMSSNSIEKESSSAVINANSSLKTSSKTPTEIEYGTEEMRITTAGDYFITDTFNGTIKVKAENVSLFLDNANISVSNTKVISSDYDLVISLIGTSTLSNVSEIVTKTTNVISGLGNITIQGSGTLNINATKSGINCAGAFYGLGGTLNIAAGTHYGISADRIILKTITIIVTSGGKDAIHAESDNSVQNYDATRGYVIIEQGASISVSGIYGDGIQADTFVLISGGTLNIETLPTWVKATSNKGCYQLINGVYTKVAQDEARNISNYWQLDVSSKGIKVGEIDYETIDANGNTVSHVVSSDEYLITIDDGSITINTTDDAIHANSGDIIINGGTFNLATSDDAIIADNHLKIHGGNINISKSYEGLEGQTVEITGGINKIVSTDDGINAANSNLTKAQQKSLCNVTISGGQTYVSAGGDGVDSNGSISISGGELYVDGTTYYMDSALDSDGGIVITGGTIIATGSSGMVETPTSSSTQYIIMITLSSVTSGPVSVFYNDTVLASFDAAEIFGVGQSYQSIIISLPSFINGNTYTVISGSVTTAVQITSIITKVGSSGWPGWPGGW
ncbi:MAG: carbohydrate-binding domain-containing protein [Erysipelotrichia bacterium]|nr:carbohydrate-binding domain-containing protein [Erysipelotrichia bacterium]